MGLIADIFVTMRGDREWMTHYSLESLIANTPREQYRLTLVMDGPSKSELDLNGVARGLPKKIDHVLISGVRLGLGPSINRALAHIDTLKRWDGVDAPPLTIYCQDDLFYSEGWFEKITRSFLQMNVPLKLGFATGATCPEHPVRRELGNGMVLKDWIRATNLVAFHSYWMSMWPISKVDPETGRERGMPHNGLGSSVDWWFIRNHENSVCRTGRTNLVLPGLVLHNGYDCSTWLGRPLPETEEDLHRIHELRKKMGT